jgi:hypothetical protein
LDHIYRVISEKTNLKRSGGLTILVLTISLLFVVASFIPPAYSSIAFNPKVNASMIDNAVSSQQIAVLGSNSSLIWVNNTSGTGEVSFARSTNNGVSYSAAIDISHTLNDSSNVQISASGNDVYVIWQELNVNHQIYFTRSTDNGLSFSPPQNLTSPLTDSSAPQIAASGNDVYAVWQDNINNQIFSIRSTNNGGSFTVQQNLTSPLVVSSAPQIVASGNNVYAAWQEGTSPSGEILFSGSTNNGASFSITQNLSNNAGDSINQQLTASGTNVYAVWQDHDPGTNQIFTRTSTDNGASFSGTQQISSTVGDSNNPQITTSNSNVYVVWYGDPGSGTPEIYFARSTNNGASYATSINLSSNSGNSLFPKIASSGSNVYVTWEDDTTANLEIFFKASSDNGSHFGSFKDLSNTPLLDSILPVIAVSSTDVYVTWQDFDSGSGFGDIFVISGSGTASTNDVTFDSSEYKLSQTAAIRVIAPASNATLPNSINVNVTSTSDPNGILVTLPETDSTIANFTGTINFDPTSSNQGTSTLKASPGDIISARFSGEEGTATIFPRTIQFDFSFYTRDKHPMITVTDQNSNLDPAAIDTISSVKLNSTSDPTGITFNIDESSINAGIFTQQINLNNSASSSLTHTINASIGDTIYASFDGKLASASIIQGVAPGGGGGGLIRPGLVLDAAGGGYIPTSLLNLIKNLNPLQPIAPSSDPTIDYPFSIDGNGFPLSSYSNHVVTTTLSTGESIPLGLTYYTPRQIQHVALYFNVHGSTGELQDSDTYIIYDVGQPLQTVDPHGFFADVKITSSKIELKHKFNYYITFAKPMEKSDVIVRTWDDLKRNTDTKILDAIQVVNSEKSETQNQVTPSTIVPSKVLPQLQKENAPDFMPSIKEWGGYSSTSISDSELLSNMGLEGNHIPSWVMKTTKWLIDGQMTQQEFIDSIKYLHDNGMIK